ncbi:hypothetical protein [uncultured Corynebacterium sp.]|uniref:hypothetical protein n=1 Tax=uncultured Corynebacterium sp. TaxID=159447 RepID=UPI0025E6990A|nr:hypothetical protein [uncultured Corynebacterium sp.]
MLKTISVIGPDARAVAECAAQLRTRVESKASSSTMGERFEVVEGAGPEQHPDIVVAAVGRATAEDREVARAVAQAMGVVLLWPCGSDAPSSEWARTPGWVWCEDVDEVCGWIRALGVDINEWEVQARRADAERLDRVRIATRLSATRIAQEVLEDADADSFEYLHAAFMARLRLAVLEQGVVFPALPESLEEAPTRPASVVGSRASVVLAAAAGLAAGLGLGTMVGRLAGVLIGVVVGVLVTLTVVGARLVMLRSEALKARAAKEDAALRQHWSTVVTEVVARLEIPPVAPRIRNLAMEVN